MRDVGNATELTCASARGVVTPATGNAQAAAFAGFRGSEVLLCRCVQASKGRNVYSGRELSWRELREPGILQDWPAEIDLVCPDSYGTLIISVRLRHKSAVSDCKSDSFSHQSEVGQGVSARS